ncbi:MAG: sugar transferase [Candidatus Hydrogenedentota bacterium]
MRGRLRGFEPAAALLLDAIVVYVAVEVALYLRFGALIPVADFEDARVLMPVIVLCRLGGFYAAGLYRRSFAFPRGFDYADLVQAWAAGTVLLAASVFFTRILETSRLVLVYESLCFLTLATFWRFLQGEAARVLRPVRAAILVGNRITAERLNMFLEQEGWEYRVSAVNSRLDESRDGNAAEAVFVAAADFEPSILVRAAGRSVFVLADVEDILLSGSRAVDLGGCVAMEVGSVRRDRHYHYAKRAIDISVSIASLLALSPLIVLVAMAVKLSSPGPVFFLQERAGHFGRSFRILKFRTMIHGAPGPRLTAVEDGRITPIGKFLRRWSLDELPQLVNVLFGSMSLVGPRPELPELVATYPAWRMQVLEATPGLTGLVQVAGRDELTDEEKARLDLFYAMNRSLEMDISILLRTFRAVIKYGGRV